MQITRETIRSANARMAEIADDFTILKNEREAAIDEIWTPIAEALIETALPANPADADAMGSDYLGTTVEGDVVAWGVEHPLGHGGMWREFEIA